MDGAKKYQKVLFLPYFPYGYCSRLATSICDMNEFTTPLLTHEEDPEYCTEQILLTARKSVLERAAKACQKGFAKDIKLICGEPAKQRSFRKLTNAGLAVVLDSPDHLAEDKCKDNNGRIKGRRFRNNSADAEAFREHLYIKATSSDPADQQIFSDLLLDAITNGDLLPLSAALDQAENIHNTSSKYSPLQLYNIWRFSHVTAMFLANDFLTYLDRRPYDTGFAIDGIVDQESYEAYVEKYGVTVAAATYRALTKWYREHPGFYQITQTQPDESEEARQAWANTPALYAAKELPSFDVENIVSSDDEEEGHINRQTIYKSHIGLAVGPKANYVLYHSKVGALRWLPTREAAVRELIEKDVLQMKTQAPEMQCNTKVDFAIYFCTSYHQFLALFEQTKERHQRKNKNIRHPMENPYASIHAVPVNNSGTTLLRFLLKSTPMGVEASIKKRLVASDENFAYAVSDTYSLTYKGKPVLMAHTMDIKKLHEAYLDHLNGRDFYIACFPEHAQWLRNLYPGKTIL